MCIGLSTCISVYHTFLTGEGLRSGWGLAGVFLLCFFCMRNGPWQKRKGHTANKEMTRKDVGLR